MIDLTDTSRRVRAYRVAVAVLDNLTERATEAQNRAVDTRSFSRAQEARQLIDSIDAVRTAMVEEKELLQEELKEEEREAFEASQEEDVPG